MRTQQLTFLFMLVMAASLIIILAGGSAQSPLTRPLGMSTHPLRFGSSGIGSTGWLMPGNTLVSTSHTSTQQLFGFIGATLNVFPYQIQSGTALYLNLYLDGQLAATSDYTLTDSYTTPATVVTTIGRDVANFSNSMLGFTVAQIPLTSPFLAGTQVTVLVWASNPIWVQVDATSLTHSYETPGLTSYPPSSVIIPEQGTVGPYTLSVGLESAAE